jgi:hypothetical protein
MEIYTFKNVIVSHKAKEIRNTGKCEGYRIKIK